MMEFPLFRAALACLAILLAIPSVAEVKPAIYTAKDYAQLPRFDQATLSPSGKLLGAKTIVGNRRLLAIYKVEALGAPPVRIDLGGADLLNWWWVNEDWIVADVFDRGSINNQSMPVTRPIAIRVDGSVIRPIGLKVAGQYIRTIWRANDGSARILVGMQRSTYAPDIWPAVVEVDLEADSMKTVLDPVFGITTWLADSDGQIRVGVGADPRTGVSKVIYRATGKGPFTTVDRQKVNSGNLLIVPQTIFPTGNMGVVFSNHEGFGWLYKVDLNTFSIAEKLVGVNNYDLYSYSDNPAGDAVDEFQVITNRKQKIWSNVKVASAQKSVEQAMGSEFRPLAMMASRDRTTVLFVTMAADIVPSYQIYSERTGTLSFVARENDKLGAEKHNPVSTVRYSSKDGLEISAVLTLPKGRAPTKLPLVVLPNSNPYRDRDFEMFHWIAQFIASRGYAVIQPNFRGSSGFGKAFLEKFDGQLGEGVQDDLNAAITHLSAKGIVDSSRVCIVGAAFGGFAALRAASRDAGLYRCAVAWGAPSDLTGLKRAENNHLYKRWPRIYDSMSTRQLAAVSPLSNPEGISIPVLLIHRPKAPQIPEWHSKLLASRLKELGKPVRYVEQATYDDSVSNEEEARTQFLEETEAFLKQHNPA